MAHTVGMIGLGIMGGAMARHMVQAGFAVVGYDLDEQAVAAARSHGVEVLASAADVARRASDVIVCLPSAKAVIATAEAIAASPAKGLTVVECSTLALKDKMAFEAILKKAGHTALDCPLSGTGAQAQRKDLVIFASGDSAAIKRLEPVFLGFGRLVKDLGSYGNGSKMKFVANHLVAIHVAAAAEAITLGEKAGLDPKLVLDVVSSGAGSSRMLEIRGPMMTTGEYEPATMRARTWKKDMTVIAGFASDNDCPVPMFATCAPLFDSLLAMGHDDKDTGAIRLVYEALAGIER